MEIGDKVKLLEPKNCHYRHGRGIGMQPGLICDIVSIEGEGEIRISHPSFPFGDNYIITRDEYSFEKSGEKIMKNFNEIARELFELFWVNVNDDGHPEKDGTYFVNHKDNGLCVLGFKGREWQCVAMCDVVSWSEIILKEKQPKTIELISVLAKLPEEGEIVLTYNDNGNMQFSQLEDDPDLQNPTDCFKDADIIFWARANILPSLTEDDCRIEFERVKKIINDKKAKLEKLANLSDDEKIKLFELFEKNKS